MGNSTHRSSQKNRRQNISEAVRTVVENLERRQLLANPVMTAAGFQYDTLPHKLTFQFDQNVSASLTNTDLYLERIGSDTREFGTRFILSYDGGTNTATFSYNFNGGILPNGDYVARLHSSDVFSSQGPLQSDAVFSFFWLQGDVSGPDDIRDGSADNDDRARVLDYYGDEIQSYEYGDLDYSGVVDDDDFNMIGDAQLATPQYLAEGLTTWSIGGTSRQLEWVDLATFETGYRIQRSSNGKSFGTIATVPAGTVSFTDTTALATSTYYYRVRAVLPSETATKVVSGFGPAATSTPSDQPPANVGSLSFSEVGQNKARVHWTGASISETGFEIWAKKASDSAYYLAKRVGPGEQSSFVEYLFAETTYNFRVRAVNTTQVSQFSFGSTTTLTGAPKLILDPSRNLLSYLSLPYRFDAQFDQPVNGTVGTEDVAITRLNGGIVLDRSGHTVSHTPGSTVFSVLHSLGTPASGQNAVPWSDGNYEMTIREGLIHDLSSPSQYYGYVGPNAPMNEVLVNGFVLQGDMNSDRKVSFEDMLTLVQNYGLTGQTYAQGNLNYDSTGTIGFEDLLIVAQRYGITLDPPPTQPGQVTAQALPFDGSIARARVQINWLPPTGVEVDGFDVFRSVNSVDFDLAYSVDDETATSATLTGLIEGKRYHFRVRAYRWNNGVKEYTYSSNKPTEITVIPWATDVFITQSRISSMIVNWKDNSTDELHFRIERCQGDPSLDPADWTSIGIAPKNATSFEDSTVELGFKYSYRVVAVGKDIVPENQLPSIAATAAGWIRAPKQLQTSALAADQVLITWKYSDSWPSVSGFVIERRFDNSASYSVIADHTTISAGMRGFVDTTGGPAGPRHYRVRAVHDNAGDMAFSAYAGVSIASTAQLFQPVITLPTTVAEGEAFILGLGTQNGARDHISEWVVNWGNTDEGADIETVGGAVSSLSHLYPDGTSSQTVTLIYKVARAGFTSSPITRTVSVTNVAPVVTLAGTTEVDEGQTVTVTLAMDDPGLDDLLTTEDWQIDWGDGNTEAVDPETLTVSHTYAPAVGNGTYNIVATVKDEDGTYTSTSHVVVVNPLTRDGLDYEFVVNAGTNTISAIRLSWEDISARETGYVLEHADDREFTQNKVAVSLPANTNTHDWTSGISAGTVHFFRVGIKRGSKIRFDGSYLPISIPNALPATPTLVGATTTSDTSIDLVWTDTSGGSAAFILERSRNGGSTWMIVAELGEGQTAHSDVDLAEGTEYHYRIKATNGVVSTSASNVLSSRTLPEAPREFDATLKTTTSIELAWLDESDGEANYVLERSVDGGAYDLLATLANNTVVYLDSGLSLNTSYSYRLKASNSSGSTAYLETGLSTPGTPTLLWPPAGLAANKSTLPEKIVLSWDTFGAAESYRLERREGETGAWVVLAAANTAGTFDDTAVANGRTYYYRVSGIDVNGVVGTASDPISATTSLAAPSNLTVQSLPNGAATLTWVDNSANELGFIVYVENGASDTLIQQVPADSTSTVLTEFGSGTTAQFYVVAMTSDMESSASNLVSTSFVQPKIFLHVPVRSIAAGESIQIDLTSQGIAGSLNWEIDWGDGRRENHSGLNGTKMHLYPAGGNGSDRSFVISVKATDGAKQYQTASIQVTVSTPEFAGLQASPSVVTAPTLSRAARARRDILQALSDIHNSIKTEFYSGTKKSPASVEDTGRANSWDQAKLLKTKVESIGQKYGLPVGADLVFGVVAVTASDLLAWMGLPSATPESKFLAQLYWAGVLANNVAGSWRLPSDFVIQNQPTGPQQPKYVRTDGRETIWHCWLRVSVPGTTWYLDPSLKSTSMNEGVTVGGPDDPADTQWNDQEFESQSSRSSPMEFYEKKITKWLIDKNKGVSIADLGLGGPIVSRQFANTSAAGTSYTTGPTVERYSVIAEVEVLDPSNIQAPIFNNGVQFDMRQTIYVQVKNHEDGNQGGQVLIGKAFAIEGIEERGVSIDYSSSGVPQITGPTGTFAGSNTAHPKVDITLQTGVPGSKYESQPVTMTRPRQLPLAVVLQADIVGPRLLMKSVESRQREMRPLVALALTEQTVSGSDAAAYQSAMLSNMANVIDQRLSEEFRSIARLTGAVSSVSYAIGVGAITGTSYATTPSFDLTKIVPIRLDAGNASQAAYVDLPGLVGDLTPLRNDGSMRKPNALMQSVFSMLESSTIEEIAGIEAMSTTKGFQWARQNFPSAIHAPVNEHAKAREMFDISVGGSLAALGEAQKDQAALAALQDIAALANGLSLWADREAFIKRLAAPLIGLVITDPREGIQSLNPTNNKRFGWKSRTRPMS
jgi:fibronectin type 3 domain-containing protein